MVLQTKQKEALNQPRETEKDLPEEEFVYCTSTACKCSGIVEPLTPNKTTNSNTDKPTTENDNATTDQPKIHPLMPKTSQNTPPPLMKQQFSPRRENKWTRGMIEHQQRKPYLASKGFHLNADCKSSKNFDLSKYRWVASEQKVQDKVEKSVNQLDTVKETCEKESTRCKNTKVIDKLFECSKYKWVSKDHSKVLEQRKEVTKVAPDVKKYVEVKIIERIIEEDTEEDRDCEKEEDVAAERKDKDCELKEEDIAAEKTEKGDDKKCNPRKETKGEDIEKAKGITVEKSEIGDYEKGNTVEETKNKDPVKTEEMTTSDKPEEVKDTKEKCKFEAESESSCDEDYRSDTSSDRRDSEEESDDFSDDEDEYYSAGSCMKSSESEDGYSSYSSSDKSDSQSSDDRRRKTTDDMESEVSKPKENNDKISKPTTSLKTKTNTTVDSKRVKCDVDGYSRGNPSYNKALLFKWTSSAKWPRQQEASSTAVARDRKPSARKRIAKKNKTSAKPLPQNNEIEFPELRPTIPKNKRITQAPKQNKVEPQKNQQKNNEVTQALKQNKVEPQKNQQKNNEVTQAPRQNKVERQNNERSKVEPQKNEQKPASMTRNDFVELSTSSLPVFEEKFKHKYPTHFPSLKSVEDYLTKTNENFTTKTKPDERKDSFGKYAQHDIWLMKTITFAGAECEVTKEFDTYFSLFKNTWTPTDDDKQLFENISRFYITDDLPLVSEEVPRSYRRQTACDKDCYFGNGRLLEL